MAERKILAQRSEELAKLRRGKLTKEEADFLEAYYSFCEKKALLQEEPLSLLQIGHRRRCLNPSFDESTSSLPGFKGFSGKKDVLQPVHSDRMKFLDNNSGLSSISPGQNDHSHPISPFEQDFGLSFVYKTMAVRYGLEEIRMIVSSLDFASKRGQEKGKAKFFFHIFFPIN
jgi:hypothetical protein